MKQILNLNILYSVAMVAVFIYVIFGTSMLAIGKSRLNALAGSVTQILVILSNVFLIDQFGIIIFPISIFVAHIVSGLYMFRYYPYSKKEIGKTFGKNVFMLLLVLFILIPILPFVIRHIPSGESMLIRLGIIGILQLMVFIGVGYFLKLEEFTSGFILLKKRFGR